MNLDLKSPGEILKIIFLCLILGFVLFILEQGFRLITSFDLWPFAFGWLSLLIYFLISFLGIFIGRILEGFFLIKRNFRYIITVFLLIYLFWLSLIIFKNFQNPWNQNQWLLRVILIIIFLGIIFQRAYYSQRYLNIFSGFGVAFLWLTWAILSPESINPILHFTSFHIFNLMIIAYLLNLSIRNLKLKWIILSCLIIFFFWIGITLFPSFTPNKNFQPTFSQRNSSKALHFQKPHLILIVLDTVRKDHLSLYGYHHPTTPFLEELAKESLVFTNAYTTAPWTLPAHASLFTGLYPHEHNAHANYQLRVSFPLESSCYTLAEVLKENHYRTCAISANFAYINQHYKMNQGFDYFSSRFNPLNIYNFRLDLVRQLCKNGFIARLINFLSSDSAFYYKYYRPYQSAEEIVNQAQQWLEKNCFDSSCFLFLNFMEAHGPYLPPTAYIDDLDKINISYWGRIGYDWVHSDRDFIKIINGEKILSERDKKILIELYDAEIKYLDQTLKKFINFLKQKNLYDNSLIIVTSDHGEFLGEKDFLGHGLSVYNQEITIPLLIKIPFAKFSKTITEVTLIKDIYYYCLACLLNNDCEWKIEHPPSLLLAERYKRYHYYFQKRFLHNSLAWLTSNYKIILRDDEEYEIYQILDNDLKEKKIIPQNSSDLLIEPKKVFQKIFIYSKQTKNAPQLSEEVKRKLKALGYLK